LDFLQICCCLEHTTNCIQFFFGGHITCFFYKPALSFCTVLWSIYKYNIY
jgi:hypothetical protein